MKHVSDGLRAVRNKRSEVEERGFEKSPKWELFRSRKVDLPPWFPAMSIALNSDVDLDFCRIKRVPMSTLPIICFRDGSPPLPDALNMSLTQSAISGINGLDVEQFFPMQENITMKLTNDQLELLFLESMHKKTAPSSFKEL